MSGGAFNYVCFLGDRSFEYLDDLCLLVKHLEEFARKFPRPLSGEETAGVAQALADTLSAATALMHAKRLALKLREVWRAAEWHASQDGSPEALLDALISYGASRR